MTVVGRSMLLGAVAAIVAAGLGAPDPAGAQEFEAQLLGFQEVPSVFSTGTGEFVATLTPGRIDYELTYDGLNGEVSQAHIHFGQRGANGGISAFLCTNLNNAPAGTPPCPPPLAVVTGSIQRGDVIGPTAQGIAPDQFFRLIQAMRFGFTYANVHSDLFPSGEIRGQVRRVPPEPPE